MLPFFADNGFCTAPGVFTPAEVADMRRVLTDIFDNAPAQPGDMNHPRYGMVRPNLLRYPEVYRRLFTPRVMSACRQLVDERFAKPDEHFVIIPEHGFHRNGFGTWHKDSDANERAGLDFHWHPGYSPVQIAIYLQDNSVEFGGGISVSPGSHKIPNPNNLLQKPEMREMWYQDKKRGAVLSKAGDLVAFDTRLDHCATERNPHQAAPWGDKLALFFVIGLRDQHAERLTAFLRSRPDYRFLQEYSIPEEAAAIAREHKFGFFL
ncbi:phytanoyl-CoA dioxygenase family protein [Noviherbaspirillum galbum]|uniref:Phytanoyl-CoA dioxygenase family protein n=1 Tax=Noviherbaspirillum galbum TaxID=2709383 RepID=A0A6B3SLX0_9BURK|nr:phytanoyl-CoA dioxygenase family protein [Noviherbaspirillum galbum]NEX59656.1 phytanoyl-CoA dioxygenase family protein [Noviherbaspirillum galbum]